MKAYMHFYKITASCLKTKKLICETSRATFTFFDFIFCESHLGGLFDTQETRGPNPDSTSYWPYYHDSYPRWNGIKLLKFCMNLLHSMANDLVLLFHGKLFYRLREHFLHGINFVHCLAIIVIVLIQIILKYILQITCS